MKIRHPYVVVVSLSLAAIGLALGLHATGSDAFALYLGPIHPVLGIALVTLTALLSLRYLQRAHGFAVIAWGRTGRGLAMATGAAAAFAVGAIAVDLGLRYPEEINVLFPQSLLFYPAIGLVVELLLHVTLLAALLLALRALPVKLGENRVIWLGVALASLVEPILQLLWAGGLSWTELYTALSVFLFGGVQLTIFRRYGFVPMYAVRLSYYLLWHITWGYVRLELLF